MFYFNDCPVSNPSDYQGKSFRDGEFWYKAFRFDDEESFRREVEMLAGANHCPHVARMRDYGLLKDIQDGKLHAMYRVIKEDFVEGETFRDYVRTHHDEEKGIRFFIRLMAPYSELYAAGIIHNDIKPDNIIVREDGEPVVIDLNISKWEHEKVADIHTDGSPGFTAPEKNRRKVTVRSDICSVGWLMKFFMDSNPDRGAAAYSDEFIAVRKRCTAENPADRYASFDEVADALSDILRKRAEKLQAAQSRKRSGRIGMKSLFRHWVSAATALLYLAGAFFLSLGAYMLFRPDDKQPQTAHSFPPSIRRDCSIVISDLQSIDE